MDLTWSIRGAKGARQFISLNDCGILAIYCGYSYGFKNVWNVIEMALKSLFFCRKITKITQWQESLPPSAICLNFINLFSMELKLDNFWVKTLRKIFGSSHLPFSKIVVALLVAFTAADLFFKRLSEPQTKRANKRCRPYTSFLRLEYKIVSIVRNL